MEDSDPNIPLETMKIGTVAKRLGVSIRTIHMYEREGLLLSQKNAAGTRYFSERDVEWLLEIRRMIKTSVGIAGIRYLLSLIPCWEITQCGHREREACPVVAEHNAPCWAHKGNLCSSTMEECRRCVVYDLRFSVGALKKWLQMSLKPETDDLLP